MATCDKRNPKPLRRTIAGVDLVTIPIADYAALLSCKQQLKETQLSVDQFVNGRRSTVDRNPEVAIFLSENFGIMPMKELLQKCKRKFGKERTPSLAAAYRYWQRVRGRASKTV